MMPLQRAHYGGFCFFIEERPCYVNVSKPIAFLQNKRTTCKQCVASRVEQKLCYLRNCIVRICEVHFCLICFGQQMQFFSYYHPVILCDWVTKVYQTYYRPLILCDWVVKDISNYLVSNIFENLQVYFDKWAIITFCKQLLPNAQTLLGRKYSS